MSRRCSRAPSRGSCSKGRCGPPWPYLREDSGWLSPEDHGDPATVRPRRLEGSIRSFGGRFLPQWRHRAMGEGLALRDPCSLITNLRASPRNAHKSLRFCQASRDCGPTADLERQENRREGSRVGVRTGSAGYYGSSVGLSVGLIPVSRSKPHANAGET
jgi:hypothetical protein